MPCHICVKSLLVKCSSIFPWYAALTHLMPFFRLYLAALYCYLSPDLKAALHSLKRDWISLVIHGFLFWKPQMFVEGNIFNTKKRSQLMCGMHSCSWVSVYYQGTWHLQQIGWIGVVCSEPSLVWGRRCGLRTCLAGPAVMWCMVHRTQLLQVLLSLGFEWELVWGSWSLLVLVTPKGGHSR